MPEPFEVWRGDALVRLVGEARTTQDRDAIRDAVAAAIYDLKFNHRERVTIDVGRAGYVDTNALATLVTCARKCRAAGAPLRLAGANADLRRMLKLTHVDQVFAATGVEVSA